MAIKRPFNVTFEVVTPESSEHGEAAESGFLAESVSLSDAVAMTHVYGPAWIDCGNWFTYTGEACFLTGEVTSFSIHPPRSISRASYARIARALCGSGRRAA